jgi:hypothetical protein
MHPAVSLRILWGGWSAWDELRPPRMQERRIQSATPSFSWINFRAGQYVARMDLQSRESNAGTCEPEIVSISPALIEAAQRKETDFLTS